MWTVIPLSFMTNFPFICSNIPTAPAYRVYLSADTICQRFGSYHDFLDRGFLLTRKLLNQRFLVVQFKSWGFSVATVTLWPVCPRRCSVCHNHNRSFPHSSLLIGFSWSNILFNEISAYNYSNIYIYLQCSMKFRNKLSSKFCNKINTPVSRVKQELLAH